MAYSRFSPLHWSKNFFLLQALAVTLVTVCPGQTPADRLWNTGRWEEALRQYDSVITSLPGTRQAAHARIQTGIYLKYQGRWQDAISQYEQAIAIAPGAREAHDALTGIAAIHYFLEDFPRALGIYQQVLEQTRDWDQIKYCSYMIRDTRRRMARLLVEDRRPRCGAASLATACSILGIGATPQELALLLPSGPEGASMADMIQAAKAKGLDPSGVILDFRQLSRIRKPVIAFMHPGHYVVVTLANERRVEYIDPAERNTQQWKLPEEFTGSWSGRALIFSRPERTAVTGFLDAGALRALRGKICYCCPPNGLGDENANGNSAFSSNPLGCHSGPGMPAVKVNLVTLNLLVQDLDFVYSGRGPTVYLQRTYNADDPRDGPFGRSWTFNYNVTLTENPNLSVDVRQASGKIDHFVRSADGSYVPPRANYSTLTRNKDGTFSLTEKGGEISRHFDAAGRLARISDRNGNAVRIEYETNGRFRAVEDPAGRRTIFTYGANNKITSVTDPAGRKATYQYDAQGNLAKTVDMAGTPVEFSYDSASYVTEIKTPKGVTRLGYYRTLREGYSLERITDALGHTKSFKTGFSDAEMKVTAADGRTTTYVNSFDGDTIAATDASGVAVRFTFDENGNRSAVEHPDGSRTSYAWDSRGNLTDVTHGRKNKITLLYDSASNLTQTTDPLGNRYQLGYDNRGNLTELLDPMQGRATFTYNAAGDLLRLVDGRGGVRSFTYDAAGNLTSAEGPGEDRVAYAWDVIGRMVSRTGGRGVFKYAYDGIDRVSSITGPDGRATRFSYDCCGATSIASDRGSHVLEYDALNRLVKHAAPGGIEIGYTYDRAGRLAALTYPDGKTVAYEYDGGGRLSTVTDWLGNTTRYSYDTAGRLASAYTAGGGAVVYRYRPEGMLERLSNYSASGARVSGHTYGYDASGNITSIAVSGIVPQARPPDSTDYTHDAGSRLLTAGPARFEHDADGNLTRIDDGGKVTELSYDELSRLIRLRSPDGESQFEYDDTGHRTVRTANGVTTRYIVDRNARLSRLLAETDAGGKVVAYYVYGLGLISKVTPDGRSYFYHFDHLGSVAAMTDAAGNAVNKYAYDPYGALSADSVEGEPNPFRYVGRHGVVDDGNGLFYMRARYYSPGLGRFLTQDPVETDIGSTYAYSGGNPISLSDPSGRHSVNWKDLLWELLKTFFSAVDGLSESVGAAESISQMAPYVRGQRIRDLLVNDPEMRRLQNEGDWNGIQQRLRQCGLLPQN